MAEALALFDIDVNDLYLPSIFNLDPIVCIYWMGANSVALSVASGLFWHFVYDDIHDWYQFIMHMAVWPQNFFFWLAVLINPTKHIRMLYFYSSLVAAAGPYILYHVYSVWIIMDAIFRPYGTYTLLHIFTKIVSWLTYSGLALFVTAFLVPEIYNYYLELWLEDYIQQK